jgi:hypothetical protein
LTACIPCSRPDPNDRLDSSANDGGFWRIAEGLKFPPSGTFSIPTSRETSVETILLLDDLDSGVEHHQEDGNEDGQDRERGREALRVDDPADGVTDGPRGVVAEHPEHEDADERVADEQCRTGEDEDVDPPADTVTTQFGHVDGCLPFGAVGFPPF